MNWKHVYHSDNINRVGTYIYDAMRLARKKNYEFMAFNGIIYFISQRTLHITNLRVNGKGKIV